MIRFFSILLVLSMFSCNTPRYTYYFDSGKHLDFGHGKWILNRSESNSEIFHSELYYTAKKEFQKILSDSLFELSDLRRSKLIAPKLKFDLNEDDLKQIKSSTGGDYLINIKGTVISDGAGTVSFQSGNGYYSSSNESSVLISIYDLNESVIISSSQVYAKITAENSHFDDDKGWPIVNTSSNTAMLKAVKKLIKKYDRYRLDQ